MNRVRQLATRLRAYIAAHRKALVGAVSIAAAAYGAQVAEGAAVIDWKRIAIAVALGAVGGGGIHAAKNTPATS